MRARGWFAKVVYLTSRFETMILFRSACVPLNVTCRFYWWKLKKSTCRSSRDLWSPKVRWASHGITKTLLVWLLSILLVPFCSLNTFFALAPGRSQKILTKPSLLFPREVAVQGTQWRYMARKWSRKYDICWTIQSLWLNTTAHMQHIVTTSSWWFQPTSSTTKQPRGKDPFPLGFPGLQGSW